MARDHLLRVKQCGPVALSDEALRKPLLRQASTWQRRAISAFATPSAAHNIALACTTTR